MNSDTRSTQADVTTKGADGGAAPETADAARLAAKKPPDSTKLFPPPIEPRFFGTGDYDSGGPHTGNYALGETNPQGGYGSFTDAGGPGSTALLGQEPLAEEPVEPAAPEGSSPVR